MSRYTNEDQRKLQELLEEGWMDRLKAKGAEALGAAKGLVKDGGFGNRGHDAKIDFLIKNIDKRFNSLVSDVKNDIAKLGLDIGNISLESGIGEALSRLKSDIQTQVTSNDDAADSQVEPDENPFSFNMGGDTGSVGSDSSNMNVDFNKGRRNARDRNRRASAKAPTATPEPEFTPNPKKGKVRKDPRAKYAAPEQEEDLDAMFWK